MNTETKTTKSPVKITEGAIAELKKLIDQQELTEEFGLRLGVQAGGCSGMSYMLGFDREQDGDVEYEVEGIRVFMNKSHTLYLAGMVVDFKSGLDARGFTFENPNASDTCGCGDSFAV
ncbi:MAG TPA: iron-sulfur cluster assembly accessory protein [Sphingobacterium sp.]|nr:iron-sulfur cluster assembly accessory protein [Sphingobacterium sp.]